MEERFNEYAKPIRANDEIKQPYANDVVNVDTTTKADVKSISKPTTRATSTEDSRVLQPKWNYEDTITEHY